MALEISPAGLEALLRNPDSEAHKKYIAQVSGAQLFNALYEMYLNNLAWFKENLAHPAPVEKEKTDPKELVAAIKKEFDDNSKKINKATPNLGLLLANYAQAVSNLISLLVQFAQIQDEIVRTHAAMEALIDKHVDEWKKVAVESRELLRDARERGELDDLSDEEIAFLAGDGNHPTADDLFASNDAHARDSIFSLWNELERDPHTRAQGRNTEYMTDLRYRAAHIRHSKGDTNVENARYLVDVVSRYLTKQADLLTTLMVNTEGLVARQARNIDALYATDAAINHASHHVRSTHKDVRELGSPYDISMPEILDLTKNVEQILAQHSIGRGLSLRLNRSIFRPEYSTSNYNPEEISWLERQMRSSRSSLPKFGLGG